MQMQQQRLKTSDVQFQHDNAFTVWIITEQFQQLAIEINMPTRINTCNNIDYNVIEVLSSRALTAVNLDRLTLIG